MSTETKTDKKQDIVDDYAFSRDAYYSLIELAKQPLEDLAALASETENPKVYEILFKGIKDISDATDKLVELQRRMQFVEKEGKMNRDAVDAPEEPKKLGFSGSTHELLKIMEDSARADIQEAEYQEIEDDSNTESEES